MTTSPEKTIEIVVAPNGHTHVQTKGFTGDACRRASRFLETALGHSHHELLTAEFHQTAPTNLSQREQA